MLRGWSVNLRTLSADIRVNFEQHTHCPRNSRPLNFYCRAPTALPWKIGTKIQHRARRRSAYPPKPAAISPTCASTEGARATT